MTNLVFIESFELFLASTVENCQSILELALFRSCTRISMILRNSSGEAILRSRQFFDKAESSISTILSQLAFLGV